MSLKLSITKLQPIAFFAAIFCCAHFLLAQTNVTTSGGFNGSIPVFTGTSSLGSSIINQNGGTIQITGSPLGTTVGNTSQIFSLSNYNSNFNHLNFTQIRYDDGNSSDLATWMTATTRIQNVTDVTPQGYIDFNPANGWYGLAFGSIDGELMRILANGNVGVGTTSPQQNLSVNYFMNIDQGGYNNGANGVPLSFGSGSGEGIGSARQVGSANLYGLDFYTAFEKRLSITNGGNVGIGTATPSQVLEVVGTIQLDGTGNGITFPDGSRLTTASSLVGSPSSLNVQGTNTGLIVTGTNLDPNGGYSLAPLQNSGKLLLGWNMSAGNGEEDFIENRGLGVSGGFRFYDYSNTGVLTPLVTMTGSGSVGIGTTNPGAALEVNGNVKLTGGSGASITFADGTVQTTAYNGTSCALADLVMPDKTIVAQGGDYAESVDVDGDRASYEPGDVMVIDPANPEHFLKSSKPYSTLVAGIYSTKPGYVGRRQSGDPKMAKTEIPMAMIGIVPTKVTTENGPVNVGDLLVTSSKEGYAMKGTDRSALSGAIVGKALAKLDSGTGTITVLVSLQ